MGANIERKKRSNCYRCNRGRYNVIIMSCPRQPKAIRTDKGSEFYNRDLKRYLKEKNIKKFYALNETKANFAERYIQTLKKRLYRYTWTFYKTPASVNKENEPEVRIDSYLARQKSQKKRPTIKKFSRRKRSSTHFSS